LAPTRKRLLRAAAMLMSAVLLPTTLASQVVPAGGAGEAADADRPNILLITTDDQRSYDLRFMPKTKRLLQRAGSSFTGISPHPLCCPARAELLTGQYAQNNGVRSNRGPYGGYRALDNTQTIATWLQAVGYKTIFMGKYLNGYGAAAEEPEPGWTAWHATVRGVTNYVNFVVTHNGTREWVRRYQTDYFTDLAEGAIWRAARQEPPFFMWQSYVAPHVMMRHRSWEPPHGPRRYRSLFENLALDTIGSPSFNEADMSDKPEHLQSRPRLTGDDVDRLTQWNRQRLRALRAVDDGVAAMLATLREAGELDDTLVIFTSDNGFLFGRHRLTGKIRGYEQALRVPLLIRGPGFPVGRRVRAVGTIVDIPATILAAADASPTMPIDGQDLSAVARRESPGVETVLVQGGPRNRAEDAFGWFYRGVRTSRYTYLRYVSTGEEELYDRRVDPSQSESVHDDPRYAATKAELKRRLLTLQGCVGETCLQRFGDVPGPSD
jgi:arylsulfatase A-like enzyme